MTDDDIGLKILRDAPADAIEPVDIVAVHGIGAHPDETWSKNVGTADNPRWVNWLVDESMLPAVAPQARIMRYGYQSQWFGKGAMRQKASIVAQRLLLTLRRKREVGEEALSLEPTAKLRRIILSDRCYSWHIALEGWWC